MQYIKTILADTFAMGFDIIMPISGIFLVTVLAVVLFLIRFTSFRHNQKKYDRRQRSILAAAVPLLEDPTDDPGFITLPTHCDKTFAQFLLAVANVEVPNSGAVTSDMGNEIIAILQDMPIIDDMKMQGKEE